MIGALKKLGFAGVSETALGAQQVSAQAAALLTENPERVLASSACPTVVCYLQKHRPGGAELLTGLLSPLLTHCKMLRQHFGADIGIVFIGPCIAKKIEAAQHPELLDVVLTFEDLRRWLEQEKIAPDEIGRRRRRIISFPENSAEGAWYPVDGGMIAGMKSACAVNDCSLMAFSGIGAIKKALEGIEELKPDNGLVSRIARVRRRLRERPEGATTRRDGDEAPARVAVACCAGRARCRASRRWKSNPISPSRRRRRCVIPIRKSARRCATSGNFRRTTS